MGGRGRGRAALSFNVEALGIAPGEALPGPQVQPPPVYPILETTPAPLQPNLEMMNRLRFKLDYLNYYSRFKNDLCDKDSTLGSKRKVTGEAAKTKQLPLEFRWEFFPAELRPNAPRRVKIPKDTLAGPSNRKPANIDDVLAALEKAEANRTVIKTEKEDADENNKNDEEQDEEVYDDSDQEMDDGTDYNQNYFDNGDEYIDDEGDDDGPIY